MRWIWLVGAGAIAAVMAWPFSASADPNSDAQDCASADPALSIPHCTRLIENNAMTPEVRLVALHNRGLAYEAQGDAARAAADYA